jgi:hypothetical protein
VGFLEGEKAAVVLRNRHQITYKYAISSKGYVIIAKME